MAEFHNSSKSGLLTASQQFATVLTATFVASNFDFFFLLNTTDYGCLPQSRQPLELLLTICSEKQQSSTREHHVT